MPNVMGVLKAEISRIARKEAKALVAPVSKPVAGARRTFADLKRRVAALEKTNRQLAATVAKLAGAQPAAPSAEKADTARITAKGIRSLRRRLKLSQAGFARLMGVTDVAVYLWERKNGALRLRNDTRARLLAVRELGAREANEQLDAMAAGKKAAGRKAAARGGRKVRRAGRKAAKRR